MKPLLAHIYEPHRVIFPCYVQPKLNGIRALYQDGHFQSRDELPFPNGLLAHLAEPLAKTFGPEVILDGELYIHGWPLQRINAAVTPVRQQPTEDTRLVEYHVFDVVDFGKSFRERRQLACKLDQDIILCRVPYMKVRCISTTSCDTQRQADMEYHNWVADGYEGMMYRLGDCPYTTPKQLWTDTNSSWVGMNTTSRFASDKDNRCWHLLKRKDWQDDEFSIIDMVEGEGKLKGMLGALKCRLPNGLHFSVGSGLTDQERLYYWNCSPIGRQVKVKYLVLSNDGVPLNPTILAIL